MEDSEPCLHWASVDWHNICSALDQNETFIIRRSPVTPLHGNISFWSERYIYPMSENNSLLNSPTCYPTSDISQETEDKVTSVLFHTEYETGPCMNRLLLYSDLAQHRFYTSINISGPSAASFTFFFPFSFFVVAARQEWRWIIERYRGPNVTAGEIVCAGW